MCVGKKYLTRRWLASGVAFSPPSSASSSEGPSLLRDRHLMTRWLRASGAGLGLPWQGAARRAPSRPSQLMSRAVDMRMRLGKGRIPPELHSRHRPTNLAGRHEAYPWQEQSRRRGSACSPRCPDLPDLPGLPGWRQRDPCPTWRMDPVHPRPSAVQISAQPAWRV